MTAYPHIESREAYRAYYNEGYPGTIRGVNPFRESYMRFFAPEPGESIVDLGCGTGASVIHYARLGHPCTGVDVSRPMLDVGRAASAGLDPAPQWVESFIEDWEPDRRYRHVLLTEVLEHVMDPLPVLAKAKEAAEEVFITAPTIRVGTDVHVRGVSEEELREWIDTVGLTLQQMWLRPTVLGGTRYHQVMARCSA